MRQRVTPFQASQLLPTEHTGLDLICWITVFSVFITEREVKDTRVFIWISFHVCVLWFLLNKLSTSEPAHQDPPAAFNSVFDPVASLTSAHSSSSSSSSSSSKVPFSFSVYCCLGNMSFFMHDVTSSSCACVCTGFCYLLRTFSGINTDYMRTNGRHGNQRPALMRNDLISEVLVKFRGKVWIEVRLRVSSTNEWKSK